MFKRVRVKDWTGCTIGSLALMDFDSLALRLAFRLREKPSLPV
jgi:hypothetical protein